MLDPVELEAIRVSIKQAVVREREACLEIVRRHGCSDFSCPGEGHKGACSICEIVVAIKRRDRGSQPGN